MVVEMNGLRASFSGDLPTLIVQNVGSAGDVGNVTSMLAKESMNIATMRLSRPSGRKRRDDYRDGSSKAIPPESLWLRLQGHHARDVHRRGTGTMKEDR